MVKGFPLRKRWHLSCCIIVSVKRVALVGKMCYTNLNWKMAILICEFEYLMYCIVIIVYLPLKKWFTILFLHLLLSFRFDWEDISNTRDSALLAIQTPGLSSKILRCASYCQLLDIPIKHRLSRLIYYLKYNNINDTYSEKQFKTSLRFTELQNK